MPRSRFDAQLNQLNVELIKLGGLCEEAIQYALKALLENDDNAADITREREKAIDKKEREIESLCMRLFMQQQPVARDLRYISSALKMISDMERIGDQAADIADISKYVHYDSATCEVHLRDMADATAKMVTQSVDSYVNSDLELARHVIACDDVVDNLFDEIKAELISTIQSGKESGEFCLDLLMITKYLERIGDHATNIAEWVEYSITGVHKNEAVLQSLGEI